MVNVKDQKVNTVIQGLHEALLQKIKDALTETQYRRLWMYCVEEMNETEIAQAEHVGQPRVCRSLCRAKIILKKIFSEGSKTGDKNG